MDDPRYPIGRFQWPAETGAAARAEWLDALAALPGQLRAAVQGLPADRLDTPYRDGGWTVRQVVHHVPDSHLNAYVRCKLALTEDDPTIRPYDEGAWAVLPDSALCDVDVSLDLLASLHARWLVLLRSLDDAAFARTWLHPEHNRRFTVAVTAALYAWHGRHHVAHITRLAERLGRAGVSAR
jgi:hypothetical protein